MLVQIWIWGSPACPGTNLDMRTRIKTTIGPNSGAVDGGTRFGTSGVGCFTVLQGYEGIACCVIEKTRAL